MWVLGLLLFLAFPRPAMSQASAPAPAASFFQLAGEDETRAAAAEAAITASWRASYAVMLVELLLFSPTARQGRILGVLERGSGERFGSDLDRWYEWIWQSNPGIHPEYADFKAALYGAIDPRFRAYFDDAPKTAIRLDEIRWGGVVRDGIPPLDHPKMLSAREATYLEDEHVVFGIELKGDARAYPKRILAWHEMVRVCGRDAARQHRRAPQAGVCPERRR